MTNIKIESDKREIKPVMQAIHDARHETIDALNLLREGNRQIEEEAVYRYIFNSYKRMKENRQFDATCTLLGIVGACFMISSAAHRYQSKEFTQQQGIGKLLEQIGSGASRFTQAEQSEIQGLIERLQQMKQQASRDENEIKTILERLDELFSKEMQQLAQAEAQMMRNTQ